MPNFQLGDLKYYYGIHVIRQRALGNTPVNYSTFTRRLKKMDLHDAIYTPRNEGQVRKRAKTPIQDAIRRKEINKEENIQILTFEEIERVERQSLKPKKPPMPRYNMKPPKKKTLLQKIVGWIKRK